MRMSYLRAERRRKVVPVQRRREEVASTSSTSSPMKLRKRGGGGGKVMRVKSKEKKGRGEGEEVHLRMCRREGGWRRSHPPRPVAREARAAPRRLVARMQALTTSTTMPPHRNCFKPPKWYFSGKCLVKDLVKAMLKVERCVRPRVARG